MFSRDIYQRFIFAVYILLIFYSLFEIYNIIFDYYGFIERIIYYHKIYFIGIQVLIIMVLAEELLELIKKINNEKFR